MPPRRRSADESIQSNPASNESAGNTPPGPAAADNNHSSAENNPSHPPQLAGKKRRASGSGASAGSRGVANLTPEQLAKKRANDREAQRAIRERTKNTIETLEKRIQELTSQQPYQELQQAIQQKELVEAENADIKRRLATVLSLIQPLLAGSSYGDNTSTYDARGQYRPPIHAALTQETHTAPYSPTSNPQTIPRTYTGQWQSTPSGPSSRGTSLVPDPAPRGRPATRPTSTSAVPSLMRTTSAERQALGLLPIGCSEIQSGEHVDEARHLALPSDSHITLSAAVAAQGGQDVRSPVQQQQQQQQQFGAGDMPASAYAAIPQHTGPSCLLDGLLLDFIADRRRLAAQGASEEEMVGPAYPDFSAFMIPERRRLSHGISKVFSDILSTFPDLSAPPEKIATYYGMFLTMRWHVCPTRANYERLPGWLRPTSWQILTPHPIWIDHLPWPEMREELVRQYQRYPFENFFVPFTKTMSVNWPFEDADVFLPQERAEDGLVMNPRFEAHMRELKNWSLGTQFSQTFPLLSTGVRIVDHDRKGEA
ncbi:MAG: hypothetical protein MMC23_007825 [Stictis urceolatum]|nr:hypothetical protein [Stictis urceolata]